MILWLEKNVSRSNLSRRVERRDVNALINASENESIFRQISRVVIKADLLRYEVSLIIFQNKIGRKDTFSVYVELTLPNNACI